jgi:hypothetical protein
MNEEQLELLPSPDVNVIGKFSNPEISGAPVTQRLAAIRAYPHTGTGRRRVLDLIARSEDGLTDQQMQDLLQMDPSTQRPRRGELEEDGWIENSGRIRRTRSGSKAVIWVLTEKGREQWRPL